MAGKAMTPNTRHAVDREVAIAKARRAHKIDDRAERKAQLERARAATNALLAAYVREQNGRA